jgi:hypothetical protein
MVLLKRIERSTSPLPTPWYFPFYNKEVIFFSDLYNIDVINTFAEYREQSVNIAHALFSCTGITPQVHIIPDTAPLRYALQRISAPYTVQRILLKIHASFLF